MRDFKESDEIIQKMKTINQEQKEYYESQFEAKKEKKSFQKKANIATNLWTITRRKFSYMRQDVGISGYKYQLHKQWMDEIDLEEKHVLDLGCFSGNELSLWIAEHSKNYIGIDLSENAIGLLKVKLKDKKLSNANARSMDFLNNDFEDNNFDLIYAHAVLHHFRDLPPVIEEIKRILKPDGFIISVDPLQTEPLNRLFRFLYRPFQSDKEWEFPFTRKTLKLLQAQFKVKEVQGILGMAKVGFPFLMIPGLQNFGKWLSYKGFCMIKNMQIKWDFHLVSVGS